MFQTQRKMDLPNILLLCLFVKASVQRVHPGLKHNLDQAPTLSDQSELQSASRSNDLSINQGINAERQDDLIGSNSPDSIQGRQEFGSYYLALQRYADRLTKFPLLWPRRSNQQGFGSGLNSRELNALSEVNPRLSPIVKLNADAQIRDLSLSSSRLGQLLRNATSVPSSIARRKLNALQNTQFRNDALSDVSSRFRQLSNRETGRASRLSLQEVQNEALCRSQALNELTTILNKLISQESTRPQLQGNQAAVQNRVGSLQRFRKRSVDCITY